MIRLLAFACALLLSGMTYPAPAEAQTRTIKLATIALSNSPWHKAMIKFKEVVEAESNGRLAVSLYTDGHLGDIGQLMTAMQLGTVEMSYYGLPSIVQLKGAETLNIMYMPYLFKSAESAERILNNDEQLKGMRLRVPPIMMLKATFEKLQTQITPMGMLDIYNALARGAVDGQDNGFDLSIPARFHEVAKHWSATDHVFELVSFFASERFWKGLSAEDRALIEKAGRQAGEVATELTRRLDAEGVEILKAAGVTYVVPNRDKFRAALADLEKEHDGKVWPAGMVERIRKLQEGP